MKPEIRIYADFNHADLDGNFLLDTAGSLEDIKPIASQLKPGMQVVLYDLCLEVEAKLQFNEIWGAWVGVPNRESFRDLA